MFAGSHIVAQLQTNSYTVSWLAVLGFLCVLVYWRPRGSDIPTINAYPRDFRRRKAREAYNTNAKALVASGSAKVRDYYEVLLEVNSELRSSVNDPFRSITTQGSRIILHSPYTDWAKSCKELDHPGLVHDDYFADYSGFDGQAVVTNPDRILIDTTRTRLSQNAQSIQVMNQQVTEVLRDIWTENRDWHSLKWLEDTMSLISRMSASIFVGPELAPNPEWQKLTITYAVNLFKAVGALRRWPGYLRPLVHWILPHSKVCREQVKLARKMVQAVLDQREREKAAALGEGCTPKKYDDTITWFEEIAAGRPYDRAVAQLALAISAVHTTSESFRQVLLELCLHPDLVGPMREEMETAISQSGWTTTALARMELVDSVMKESQRFKSAIVGIERKVIRDTTLPNGTGVPRGSIICVDSSDMWSTEVHDHPQVFNGYRFLRMRQRGGKSLSTAPYVSSTKEHNTFGAGKFICPGRFFVANEMKIALAHVLLKYDLRLKDDHEPRNLQTGFYPSSDLEVNVEVMRRDCDLDIGSSSLA